jgi:hypothetical protein
MRNYYFAVLLLSITITRAQAPNDCINAITICGNGVFSSNASGVGTLQEVSGCAGFENNSIWLKIHIAESGTLGLHIIPVDPDITVDYDFWVYAAGVSCSTLGAPIRCCTTNPSLAGLIANQTGMNNTSVVTSAGPGANGNGYVSWLNVEAGQTYYIAIDRPVGDVGFELYWIGSAVLMEAPTVNSPTDFMALSTTSDVSIFNLDAKRSEISSDLVANSVDFFATLANAVDNVSALPNITENTSNPQLIYARVTNNTTGCFSLTQFNLIVSSSLSVDEASANAYKFTAYPNPFNNDFVIDAATTNPSLIKIKVYDMLGKLIEQRVTSSSKISSQKIGQKYAAGIYNVMVLQEDVVVKVFQVIKK